MGRNVQETKKRLLEAATQEFAQRGIAGARMDRIAELADCSKALIYDYFGNKDRLFDIVYDALVVELLQEVPFDASDLPGYAGRLFDQSQAHPEILRLTAWDLLERGGLGARLPVVQTATQHKIAAITQAQSDGRVSKQWSPAEVLLLITSLTAISLFAVAEGREPGSTEISNLRHTVVEAVRQLVDSSAKESVS